MNLQDLYNYHDAMNHKLMHAHTQHPLSERSIRWFSHILNAHHIWNARIEGKPSQVGVWDVHAAQDWASLHDSNQATTLTMLAEKEMPQEIFYKNSKGHTFINQIGDILFHIINHSTYHRGQIAMDMREQGLDPVVTDYIFYKRQQDS